MDVLEGAKHDGGIGRARMVPGDDEDSTVERTCIACGTMTFVVKIGLPSESREAIKSKILLKYAAREQSRAKRRKTNKVQKIAPVTEEVRDEMGG